MFGQRIAESHHHAAFHLSFQSQRIDDSSDIRGGDHVQHAHFAGIRVDFHFCGLRRVGECHMHITTFTERLGFRRPVFIQCARLLAIGLHLNVYIAQGD